MLTNTVTIGGGGGVLVLIKRVVLVSGIVLHTFVCSRDSNLALVISSTSPLISHYST